MYEWLQRSWNLIVKPLALQHRKYRIVTNSALGTGSRLVLYQCPDIDCNEDPAAEWNKIEKYYVLEENQPYINPNT
jgi:hypothetical protein